MGCSSDKVAEEKVEEEVIPEAVYDEEIEINLNENPFAQNLFNNDNNNEDNGNRKINDINDVPVYDKFDDIPVGSKGTTMKSLSDSRGTTLKSTGGNTKKKPLTNSELSKRFYLGVYFNYNNRRMKAFQNAFESDINLCMNELNDITSYDHYIKTDINKIIEMKEVEAFKNSKKLEELVNLSEDEIDRYILYCNNSIYRTTLYMIKSVYIEYPPNFSLESKDKLKEKASEDYINKCKAAIKNDFTKTFPTTHKRLFMTQEFSNNFHSILFEMCLRNNPIGYSNGMNLLVAYLLMLFGNDVNMAFYFYMKFLGVTSKQCRLCFYEIYNDNSGLLKMLLDLFRIKLFQYLPQVDDTINKLKIKDEDWIEKWFKNIFLDCFSFDMVIKFFDIVLVKGLDSMIIIALCFCDLMKDKIVKCTNMTQFNKIIKNGVVTISEGEKLNLYINIFKEFQTKKFQIK